MKCSRVFMFRAARLSSPHTHDAILSPSKFCKVLYPSFRPARTCTGACESNGQMRWKARRSRDRALQHLEDLLPRRVHPLGGRDDALPRSSACPKSGTATHFTSVPRNLRIVEHINATIIAQFAVVLAGAIVPISTHVNQSNTRARTDTPAASFSMSFAEIFKHVFSTRLGCHQ